MRRILLQCAVLALLSLRGECWQAHVKVRPVRRIGARVGIRVPAVTTAPPFQRLVSLHAGGGPLDPSRWQRKVGGGGGGGGGGGFLIPVLLLLFAPGLVFKILNTGFILLFLGPPLAIAAFNLYINLSTQQAPCANCGAEVLGPKSGLAQCQSCGQELVARENAWAIPSQFAGEDGGAPRGYNGPGASDGVIDV